MIHRLTQAVVAVFTTMCCATAVCAADSLSVQHHAASDSLAVAGTASSVAPRSEYLPGPFDMFTNLPGDWYHWAATSFVKENLPVMGLVAVGTAAGFLTDRPVYDAFHKQYNTHTSVQEISDQSTFIGDGKFQFGVAVAMGAYGFLWKDARAIRTSSQIVEVILACGGVVQLLKHITGRESPFVSTLTIGRWDFFPNQITYANNVPHYDAFPSGHVATALATLTVITENYPEATWVKWLGYSAITGLGLSMVANGIHWWSDYPLSIAMGLSFGKLVAHPQQFESVSQSGVKTSLRPTVFPNGVMGIEYAVEW